jgi:RHS repeat-associated protein
MILLNQSIQGMANRSIGKWAKWFLSIIIFLTVTNNGHGQKVQPYVACYISGQSPVTLGDTWTYTLNGGCSASSWTVTCGTIVSSTNTSVTINFNQLYCSSSKITAVGAPVAAKTVTVNQPPPLVGGTISNTFQAINYNTTPAVINASAASGGNCGGAYLYTWYSSTDGVNFSPISNSNVQNYQPPALTATTYYERQVGCNSFSAYTSNYDTIKVYPQLVAGSVTPSPQSINYNTVPATLSISSVSGGTGSYTYQWNSSSDGIMWTPISGAVNPTYAPPALTTTTYYLATVFSNGAKAISNSGVVNVYPQLTCSINPSSQSINYNTTPVTLTSSVSGGNGSYSYQWQISTDNTNWSIVGTSSSYSPGALTATTYYKLTVTSNGVSTSSTTTVTVYPPLQGGSATPSQTINYGRVPAQLSLTGVSGGSGTYGYQWYFSKDNNTWISISNATSATYAPGPLITTTYFMAAVTSNGATVNNSSATITVNPQVVPGTITPGSITIASGTSPGTLIVNPATGGACNNSSSYQWQSSTDNVNWTNINGAAGLSYAPGNLSANMYYRQQVTCGTDIEFTNTSSVVIGTVNTNLNYIRERDIVKPGVTDSLTASQLASPTDARQTTQYFDGLGRPIQTVNKQLSPLGYDQVALQVYDQYGREAVKYLPYTSPSSDGNYKANALSEQNGFNSTQFPGEQYYYGQVNYEASSLNSPITTFAPGASWMGSSRGIQSQHLINIVNDSVRIWIPGTNPSDLPSTTATYLPGTLYKFVTIDERGNQLIEYKDFGGYTVLKKVQLSPAPGSAHVGWLCTYYVYDDLYNLRFVLQPNAVNALLAQGNWTLSAGIRDELCFYYGYDPRNRVSIKKVPGAGEVWMVYDVRDRLVMTQDANLRGLKWLVTVYDSLNRPVQTGLLTDANNQAYHQNLAYNSNSYPNTSTNFELLTQTYYDNYNWTTGTGLGSSLDQTYTSNSAYFNTSYNTSPAYAQQIKQSVQTTGMVTGSMAKVIGTTSQYLYTVSFYDDRGRTIQTQNINYTGGKDIVTTQYDFSGKVLRTLQQQQKNGNNTQSHVIVTKFNYDGAGRMLTVYKNIDGAAADQLIATNSYNELGQLQNKAEGNSIENLAYAYNIRGWLTSINKNWLGGTSTNYFGMELAYDKTTAAVSSTSYSAAQFNGNIAGTIWKSKGDGINRKYDFTYDNVNRLTAANFVQNTSGSTWDNGYIDFTTNNLSYDGNGNILSMNQKGFKVGGSALIDQLTYSYQSNSNKLSQVNDAVNDPNSKLGDFHYSGTKQATDYSYDGNGNLTLDNNKAISSITYNYLNLPNVITVTGKGTITYTYDAAGNKLQKVTSDNTVSPTKTTTTLYLGNAVYQNDTLQFIGHEEGRTRWAYHKYLNGNNAYGYEYDYFLKDHLGDTRMVLTQQKDTAKYLASMEAAYRATETQLFSNITTTCYPRASVSGYPNDLTVTNPNDSVIKVNGNGPRMGPGLLLKVMSGDTVDVATQFYYLANGTVNSPTSSLNDVLNSLAAGIVNMAGGSKGSLSDLTGTSSPVLGALNSFLPTNDPNTTSKPKAYLNWILLDDQLKYVSSYPQSGAMVVGNAGTNNGQLQPPLANSRILITKNGYFYAWVSNETPGWDVFFDNLSVTHRPGPVLEETHYYPFGLTMAGISSQALKTNYAVNKYKFNDGTELQNKEFSDGSGLELYETPFRSLDPQIGRFHQIDPLGETSENWSPYSFVQNNPLFYSDPWGLDTTVNGVHYPDAKTLPAVVVQSSPNLIKHNSTASQATIVATPGTPSTSGTGSNVPGVAVAAVALVERDPRAVALAGAAILTYGLYNSLTSDNNYTANPSIPLPGFFVRDNTGTKPLVITPPISVPIARTMEPHGEQYTLRARADGYYPNREWGKGIVGVKWLNKGDIWKIGTTINGRGRYTNPFYDNTGQGLDYVPEFSGPIDQVLFAEKMKLLNYAIQHNGALPPGNTKLQ